LLHEQHKAGHWRQLQFSNFKLLTLRVDPSLATMDEITSLTATRIVDLIKSGQLSPVEVISAYLWRIEQLNPQLNAFITLAQNLEQSAKDAEAAVIRGDPVGALHGLPISIKDTIETAGIRSTSGSRMRADFVPSVDAPAVARLKAAGAIVLGKTNAAEMAMDYNADNPLFGRTNNPYKLSYTPGGSSGGEAAAIAAGMSCAGLGSDLAGSIRIPAHFCGIAGFKPSTGSVPGEGQFPPGIGPYSLGAVIGPMARTVGDLELLFSALAQNRNASLLRPEDLKGTRVAFYTDDGVAPVTEETRKAVKAAAAALASAGLSVEELMPPGIEQGYDLWLKLFSRASVVQLRDVYDGNEEEGGSFVRWRLSSAEDSSPQSLDEYIRSWMQRDRLREKLLAWMKDVPLLIAPVGSTNAFEHDTLKVNVDGSPLGVFRAFSYCQTFNVFDLPAVCVPAGSSSDGLPIGVQIVGRPNGEDLVLAAARIVEVMLGRGNLKIEI
jgi:Asp-tRNA(Asn)/Glu-tRNA(Gln) amidotransferase A subunit family amidase